MSGIALIWAANTKGLKPAAKVVLFQLADFHNKETGQCNPSAKRLAADCEMSRATLFRHMVTLEGQGLVTRHARGDGGGGRGSNQYELHLNVTPSSGSAGSYKKARTHKLVSQNDTRGNASNSSRKGLSRKTRVVSNRDTNLTIDPDSEPPTREQDAAEVIIAEKILAPYPADKLRGKDSCIEKIKDALTEGFTSKEMLEAVKAYATGSAGYSREKVCWSDNWFRDGRWLEFIEDIRTKRTAAQIDVAHNNSQLARWIIECSPKCRLIAPLQLETLLAAKLVTDAQVQAAGLNA
jgi:hypothetical protein